MAILFFIFSVLVFSHHIFMDIPNPIWLQMVAQTASLGIVFPSALTIFTALFIYMAIKNFMERYNEIFLCWHGWMGIRRISRNPIGIVGNGCIFAQYHVYARTYPSHVIAGTCAYGVWSQYAILPDLTKKHLSKNLGEIHFWLTIFGGFGLALLFSIIGAEGAIRRDVICQLPL